MNSSCAFYIGTTHDVCQDYTLSGKRGVVISDGCSGSPLTDVGSRVLAITAMNKLPTVTDLSTFDIKECILLARPSTKMLDLPDQCLDATLFGVFATEEKAEVISYGDGIIAISCTIEILQEEKKGILVICTEYTDSYPFYPNYLYDTANRYEHWIKMHNKRKITASFIEQNSNIIPFGEQDVEGHALSGYNAAQMKMAFGGHRIYINCVDLTNIEWIAVMSDGINSFYETIETDTSRNNVPVPYLEVLKELFPFKNFKGSFVQRRINKFRKNCKKKNWHNADDVSLAAVYIGE